MYEYCSCASEANMDVLFLMDISGSIGSSSWEVEKRFVSDMITNGMTSKSSAAIVTFGTGARSHWNFTDAQHPRTNITNMVNQLNYTGGSTYTATGLNVSMTVFNKTGSKNATNLLFLITDGDPFPSWTQSVCDDTLGDTNMKARLDRAGI